MSSVFNDEIKISTTEIIQITDPKEFRKVVENRRSVRVYESESIPDHIVNECLELALLAPNSSNLQAWEFYRVKTPALKAALAKICMSQNAARTAAELIVVVARIDKIGLHRKQMLKAFESSGLPVPKSVKDYYGKLVPFVYATGPLSIFAPFKWLIFNIAGLFNPMPREPLGKTGLKIWAIKSAALACENLMLAFSSYGYDTCPMEGFDSKRLKKLLKLPRSAQVVMVVSAGKRKPEGVYGPRIRFPSSQFLFEV